MQQRAHVSPRTIAASIVNLLFKQQSSSNRISDMFKVLSKHREKNHQHHHSRNECLVPESERRGRITNHDRQAISIKSDGSLGFINRKKSTEGHAALEEDANVWQKGWSPQVSSVLQVFQVTCSPDGPWIHFFQAWIQDLSSQLTSNNFGQDWVICQSWGLTVDQQCPIQPISGSSES